MYGPDPDRLFPNEQLPRLCFIKNAITRPNIVVGEYTYYDDDEGANALKRHVTHHYESIGDNSSSAILRDRQRRRIYHERRNHRMNSATTYPFNIMGGGWSAARPRIEDLPLKGDTIVGNDVWIGQNVTILPGVRIGDGRSSARTRWSRRTSRPITSSAGTPPA